MNDKEQIEACYRQKIGVSIRSTDQKNSKIELVPLHFSITNESQEHCGGMGKKVGLI